MRVVIGVMVVCVGIVTASALAEGTNQSTWLTTVGEFHVPESARYDPERDLCFVGNVTGHPIREDDDGFISPMDPDGNILTLRWIDGASPSATLHAPKGLAIVPRLDTDLLDLWQVQ